ncbi:MAG: alpha/beta hydrolase [Pseudomonadota bacterium]
MPSLKDFHHQIVGQPEAPKLVFLHGLMGSGGNWRRIAKTFQENYQVLTYDQRGHGRSFHAESYKVEDFSSDLKAILDELGWDTVTLVGHSMGGRNAFHFASQHPVRVQKLVIEDISPAPDEASSEKIRRMINLVPTPFADRKQAKAFFENDFPKALLGNPQAKTLADYFYTNMAEQPDGSTSWRFHLQGIFETMDQGRISERWAEVEGLKMPTLWMRGSESQDLSKEHFQRVLDLNAIIRGVEIAPSGHWIHFDQPEKFIQSLMDFFAS